MGKLQNAWNHYYFYYFNVSWFLKINYFFRILDNPDNGNNLLGVSSNKNGKFGELNHSTGNSSCEGNSVSMTNNQTDNIISSALPIWDSTGILNSGVGSTGETNTESDFLFFINSQGVNAENISYNDKAIIPPPISEESASFVQNNLSCSQVISSVSTAEAQHVS